MPTHSCGIPVVYIALPLDHAQTTDQGTSTRSLISYWRMNLAQDLILIRRNVCRSAAAATKSKVIFGQVCTAQSRIAIATQSASEQEYLHLLLSICLYHREIAVCVVLPCAWLGASQGLRMKSAQCWERLITLRTTISPNRPFLQRHASTTTAMRDEHAEVAESSSHMCDVIDYPSCFPEPRGGS